ncbi:CheB methylesterase domain-containing protein [Marinitoga arctica]
MKVIIGASAGGPATLKELFNFNEKIEYPIILAMHNLANQTENFKKYLSSISNQKVYIINNPTIIEKGIYIPEGGKDLIFISKNIITTVEKSDYVAPSINKLFETLYSFSGENTYVILLGGLGNDGTKGIKKLEKTKTNIYIQKDAQFTYMTRNAMKEIKHYILLNIIDLKNLLISLNKKVKK